MTKHCLQCNQPFHANYSSQKFCCRPCFDSWRSGYYRGEKNCHWMGGKIKKECEICGKIILAKRNEIKKGHDRFCSRKCYGDWCRRNRSGKNSPRYIGGRRKVIKECQLCHNSFLVDPGQFKWGYGKFCSRKCLGLWNSRNMRGDKHWRWKGGISADYINHTAERQWQKIRRQCYRRDKYRCQICGVSGIRLDAHHIIPWRISHDDTLQNLIALCRKCHRMTEVQTEKKRRLK